mgnify:CR=1 FL=1
MRRRDAEGVELRLSLHNLDKELEKSHAFNAENLQLMRPQ